MDYDRPQKLAHITEGYSKISSKFLRVVPWMLGSAVVFQVAGGLFRFARPGWGFAMVAVAGLGLVVGTIRLVQAARFRSKTIATMDPAVLKEL